MTTINGLKLGEPANLLFGFKPFWEKDNKNAKPFFAPRQSSTVKFDVELKVDSGLWDYPTLSLHDDALSLINRLYDYQLVPSDFDPSIFSLYTMQRAGKDVDYASLMKSFGDYIGVDLTKGDSYMLIKIERNAGKAVHPFTETSGSQNLNRYLTQDALAAIDTLANSPLQAVSLSTLSKLSVDQINEYLEFCYEYGTHFVSAVKLGDVIFQVFGISKNNYRILKSIVERESGGATEITGVDSLRYRYYSSPHKIVWGHFYGYVTQYGSIVSFGQDYDLSTSLENGDWIDNRFAPGNSIFMAYDKSKNGIDFLRQFRALTPIGFELSPITEFLNDKKLAKKMDYLFKGALLHEFVTTTQLGFTEDNDFTWNILYQKMA